jgi:hypothetical protein
MVKALISACGVRSLFALLLADPPLPRLTSLHTGGFTNSRLLLLASSSTSTRHEVTFFCHFSNFLKKFLKISLKKKIKAYKKPLVFVNY